MFKQIWVYRDFILGSVKRDFQSRYRNSVLGAIWLIINPLYMIVLFTLIFSHTIRPGLDNKYSYAIYVASGSLTWGFFIEILTKGQNVFLEAANIIKKLKFPRACIPIIIIMTTSLNFIISFGLFTGFLLISGNFPGWHYLAIFPILIIQSVFAISLGVMLGIANVFFRDVAHSSVVIFQVWFWITPIVYIRSGLSPLMQRVVDFNPITPIIEAHHAIFVHQEWPDWNTLIFPMITAMLLFIFSARVFSRAGEMVDEL